MIKQDIGYFMGAVGIVWINYLFEGGWLGIGFLLIWGGIYYYLK